MKFVVNGANGRMGQTVCSFVQKHPDFELVAQLDRGDDPGMHLCEGQAEIWVDFTVPEARMPGIEFALRHKIAAVVGTTGYTPEDLETIRGWVETYQCGCVIAPNFQVGNVLMQHFAARAASYFDYAEIIEYHHENKVDYPSGTAMKTAEMMQQSRREDQAAFNRGTQDQVANLEGARGGNFAGIRVHALRMPGYIASQEVIFGAAGQRLSIRHDSIDRDSYMPGVEMAARYIADRAELVYGLESILGLELSPT